MPTSSTIAEGRIRSLIRRTPLSQSPLLSGSSNARVFLKLENLQETGAFKLRGAAHKLLALPKDQAARGIVAASTGNHAIAVATIGRKLGIPVEIFASEHLHPLKRAKIESLGARLRTVAGDALLAEQTARQEAGRAGRPYVSPYNDADVIAGQGTVAVEVLDQLREQGIEEADAVFVAVGGGGLIGGIGAHLKETSPRTHVVGCWPVNSPALFECIRAGEVIDVPESPTLSTSTAGGVEEGSITLELCRRVIDRSVLVSEAEILAAARVLWRNEKILIEGAAAVAVAAFLKTAGDYAGKAVVIVICGGNVDPGVEALIKESEPGR
jgi:threonine dehydratase